MASESFNFFASDVFFKLLLPRAAQPYSLLIQEKPVVLRVFFKDALLLVG